MLTIRALFVFFLFSQVCWAGNVLFLSRFDEGADWFSSPNSDFLGALRDAGHEVNIELTGDLLRPVRFEPRLVDALSNADLVIVPPSAPSRDTGSFGGGCGPRVGDGVTPLSAIDPEFYFNVDRPMLILDGATPFHSSRRDITSETPNAMTVTDPSHRYVAGLGGGLQVFDWSDDSVATARAPTMTTANLSGRGRVLATLGTDPFLVEVTPDSGTTTMPRVHLGHWDYDLSVAGFFDATTQAYQDLFWTIANDLLDGNASSSGAVTAPINPAVDYNGDGVYGTADVNAMIQAIRSGDHDARFDLDGDGSVSDADRVELIEYRFSSYLGDSNWDGIFSSADLVQVFQFGKFENGAPAIWDEGDWNGDGFFSSSDFVRAFVDGGYCAGPRAAHPAMLRLVPEPTGAWVVWIGFGLLAALRRPSQRPIYFNGP